MDENQAFSLPWILARGQMTDAARARNSLTRPSLSEIGMSDKGMPIVDPPMGDEMLTASVCRIELGVCGQKIQFA